MHVKDKQKKVGPPNVKQNTLPTTRKEKNNEENYFSMIAQPAIGIIKGIYDAYKKGIAPAPMHVYGAIATGIAQTLPKESPTRSGLEWGAWGSLGGYRAAGALFALGYALQQKNVWKAEELKRIALDLAPLPENKDLDGARLTAREVIRLENRLERLAYDRGQQNPILRHLPELYPEYKRKAEEKLEAARSSLRQHGWGVINDEIEKARNESSPQADWEEINRNIERKVEEDHLKHEWKGINSEIESRLAEEHWYQEWKGINNEAERHVEEESRQQEWEGINSEIDLPESDTEQPDSGQEPHADGPQDPASGGGNDSGDGNESGEGAGNYGSIDGDPIWTDPGRNPFEDDPAILIKKPNSPLPPTNIDEQVKEIINFKVPPEWEDMSPGITEEHRKRIEDPEKIREELIKFRNLPDYIKRQMSSSGMSWNQKTTDPDQFLAEFADANPQYSWHQIVSGTNLYDDNNLRGAKIHHQELHEQLINSPAHTRPTAADVDAFIDGFIRDNPQYPVQNVLKGLQFDEDHKLRDFKLERRRLIKKVIEAENSQ